MFFLSNLINYLALQGNNIYLLAYYAELCRGGFRFFLHKSAVRHTKAQLFGRGTIFGEAMGKIF